MEEIEREHIRQNLVYCIANTECTTTFLTIFVQEGILDKDDLNSVSQEPGPTEKAFRLYHKLESRLRAYSVLLNALERTGQSGVRRMLGRNYTCGLNLGDRCRSKGAVVIILCSPHWRITYNKLKDTEDIKLKLIQNSDDIPLNQDNSLLLILRPSNLLGCVLNCLGRQSGCCLVITEESETDARRTLDKIKGRQELRTRISIEQDDIKWTELSLLFQHKIKKKWRKHGASYQNSEFPDKQKLVETMNNIHLEEDDDATADLGQDHPSGRNRRIIFRSRFKKGVPKDLQDFLVSPDKVLLMSTLDISVTMEKISDNVENNKPILVAQNKMELGELMEEHSKSAKLFMLQSREEDKIPDSKWVADLVSSTPEGSKAIILHTILNHGQLAGLRTIAGLMISRDQQSWTDLKCWFQDQLLDKRVRVQSKGKLTMSVREILELEEVAGEEHELQDETLLVNLIKDRTPDLLGPLPSPLSYYVERKIRPRFVLNEKAIFTKEKNDIFLFTGIERRDLSPYLYGCNHCSDQSGSQVTQLSENTETVGNYFLLENTDHFDQICKNAKKGIGVHWLHHDNKKFIWVKSGNGNMTRIQRSTEGMTKENQLLSEADFVSKLETRLEEYGNCPVLIADTPGMGKSTLLQSLGRRILKEYSGSRIVLFVAIKDLVDLLKENTKKDLKISEELFENVLLQKCGGCGSDELAKTVLKNMSREQSPNPGQIKVELMLDGYDEIISEDLPIAKKLLTLVQDSYHHSSRIWVATRPHLMQDLENELHVTGFTIHPFDEADQKHFLMSFWQSKIDEQRKFPTFPCLSRDLLTFTDHCIESVKNVWTKNYGKEDICGVPLQCLLIAEVYQVACLLYVNRRKRTAWDKPALPQKITSIKGLYEALISKKLEIYMERYALQLHPEMKRNILRFHYFLALQHLFPNYAQVFKQDLTLDGFRVEDILNVGIVESMNQIETTATSFGHRTVAEFLVACFVAEELCEEDEFDLEEKPSWRILLNFLVSIIVKRETHKTSFTNYDLGNLIFDGVLKTKYFMVYESTRSGNKKFEHQVLVYFLDSMLEGRSLDKLTRLGNIVAGRKRPVKACVYGDHLSLVKALKIGHEDIDPTTFLVAVSYGSKRFLQYICEKYYVDLSNAKYSKPIKVNKHYFDNTAEITHFSRGHTDYDNKGHQYFTLVHLAVECREFSIVEYLLNCQGFGKFVQDFDPLIQDLLHALVLNSNKNPEFLIKEKIEVLGMLVSLNPSLLKGRTASCTELEKRLQHWGGEDFPQISRRRDTNDFCMRYCKPRRRHLTPLLQENVHVELTMALLKVGGNPFEKDENDSNLLHSSTALSADDFHRVVTTLTDEQVRTLVNAKTKDKGSSVLHKIAENLRRPKKETLEHLLKLGADFAVVDFKQQSCLHVAASVGNVEAARLFLELGMHAIVNGGDDKGDTPLEHLLMNKVSTEHLREIGKLFLEHGATLTIDKNTLLNTVRYREYKTLSRIQFLLEVNVSTRENDLKTLLHFCVGNLASWFELAELLLENGAELESVNENGETPIQTLIRGWKKPYTDMVKTLALLLSKGAHVRSKETAQSAFLLAIRESDYLPYGVFEKAADSLVKDGAQLRTESGDGIALLVECAKEGLFNGIMYLVENGVDVNGSHNGETALHAVVDTYKYRVIAPYLLAKGAKMNIPDGNGLNPLERLIKVNSFPKLEVLSLFLAKGKELTPLKSKDATRILFRLVDSRNDLGEKELLEIAQSKLLAEGYLDIDTPDKDKLTLLHYAAQRRYPSLVKFLLEKGAKVNVINGKGKTPLHDALDSHSFRNDPVHIVETLMELMKAERVNLKAVDFQRNTIFDLSLNKLNTKSPVVKHILGTGQFDAEVSKDEFLLGKVEPITEVDTLQELFARFAQVNTRTLEDVGRASADPEKCSILHVAVQEGNFGLVTFLLDSKTFVLSSLSKKEFSRFSNLLHVCVRDTKVRDQFQVQLEMMRRNIILKLSHHNKALLNSIDLEGRTPILVNDIHIDLLQVLVELGADFNFADGNGDTVAQLAAKYLNAFDKIWRNTDNMSKLSSQVTNSFAPLSWKALPLLFVLSIMVYKYKWGAGAKTSSKIIFIWEYLNKI